VKHSLFHIAFLSFFVSFLSCTTTPEVPIPIVACADLPTGVASALSFAADGCGYVLCGRTQSGDLVDSFWQYCPDSDRWSALPTPPIRPRVKGIAQPLGDKVYIGLGFNGHAYADSSYLHDFWCYTPSSGAWQRLSDFPSNSTVGAVSYACNGKIYILYGFGYGFTREISVYDPATDSWQTYEDNHRRALAALGMTGATVAGRTFIGTGFNTRNLSQWYEADLEQDRWTKCASVPTAGRQVATAVANSRYIYLMGGHHFGGTLTTWQSFSDILRYDPLKDQWAHCGSLPFGAAESMVAFAIGERIYFGLGEDANGTVFNHLYSLED